MKVALAQEVQAAAEEQLEQGGLQGKQAITVWSR
jgi:hypothetical protein